MTCADIEAIVDDIAAGVRAPDAGEGAHMAGCARCEASLALARRVEALLSAPVPPVPVSLTSQVLKLVQRERWQSEQRVDRVFNVAMIGGAVLVAGGVWMLASASGLSTLASDAISQLTSSHLAVQSPSPQMWAYALSGAVLAGVAGLWWWIERGGVNVREWPE
jgi:hypothetical protein